MKPHDKRRRAARAAALKRSIVGTLSDRQAVNALYKECKARRAAGEKVRVGHIIPLRHKLVSGLTVPSNLRIMTAEEDKAMGNNFKPIIKSINI